MLHRKRARLRALCDEGRSHGHRGADRHARYQENAQLGRVIAAKLSAARGPLTLFIPCKGVSAIDVEGAPFYDPAPDAALIEALREGLDTRIEVRELDTHVNDPAFARAMADRLHELYTAWAQNPREGAQ
jgi:uncharacterized protein (UPF0261 family)